MNTLPDGAPPEVVAAFNRLTAKQRVFALALPTSASHEAAMLAAGYAESTARKKAGMEATNPDIVAIVNWLVAQAVSEAKDSVERVLEELCNVGMADPIGMYDENDNLLPMRMWPEELRRAVSGVEVFEEYQGKGKDRVFIGFTKKVKFWDKNTGLASIAKIKGYMRPEQHEHVHRIEGLSGLLKELDGADTGPGPASSRRG